MQQHKQAANLHANVHTFDQQCLQCPKSNTPSKMPKPVIFAPWTVWQVLQFKSRPPHRAAACGYARHKSPLGLQTAWNSLIACDLTYSPFCKTHDNLSSRLNAPAVQILGHKLYTRCRETQTNYGEILSGLHSL